MSISIYVPGMEVKAVDPNKTRVMCDVAFSIMDGIYYEDGLNHDVMTIHDEEGSCIAEVILKPNPSDGMKGFTVRNRWYCLPDAQSIVGDIIAEELNI